MPALPEDEADASAWSPSLQKPPYTYWFVSFGDGNHICLELAPGGHSNSVSLHCTVFHLLVSWVSAQQL